MPSNAITYTAALNWIAGNVTDLSWLQGGRLGPSAAPALMVADLFNKKMDRIIVDLTKVVARDIGPAEAGYEWLPWREVGRSGITLVPAGEKNHNAATRIAHAVYDERRQAWDTTYFWPHGAGHKAAGRFRKHKTIRGTQRWVEKNLKKFDNPPLIRHPEWDGYST